MSLVTFLLLQDHHAAPAAAGQDHKRSGSPAIDSMPSAAEQAEQSDAGNVATEPAAGAGSDGPEERPVNLIRLAHRHPVCDFLQTAEHGADSEPKEREQQAGPAGDETAENEAESADAAGGAAEEQHASSSDGVVQHGDEDLAEEVCEYRFIRLLVIVFFRAGGCRRVGQARQW